MRIISWNCQGKFRAKLADVWKFQPDVLVIQECEDFEQYNFKFEIEPTSKIWVGDRKPKGLGILSFGNCLVEKIESKSVGRFVIPVRVRSEEVEITLFAIWAMDDKIQPRNRYIGQVWLALQEFEPLLNERTILIGDFNSNAIWDNPKRARIADHSGVVDFLGERKIQSVYHFLEKQRHGKEEANTFFLYRKPERGYHIDFCFASENLIERESNFEIGKIEAWIGRSDHMPIVFEFQSKT
jgi:exonuclease III